MARNFGSGAYLNNPTPALVRSRGVYSVVVWFRSADQASYRTIYAEEANFDDQFFLRLNNNGLVDFWARLGSDWAPITSAAAYDDNLWHWVLAVKRAANDFEVFVDGASIGTNTTTVGTSAAAGAAAIGNWHPNTGLDEPFLGDIARFAIFDVALSVEQAASFAYTGRSYMPSILWAEMVGGNSPEPDWAGGSGLSVNGTTVADHPPVSMPLIGLNGWQVQALRPVGGNSVSLIFAASATSATPDSVAVGVLRAVAIALSAVTVSADAALGVARTLVAAASAATATSDTLDLATAYSLVLAANAPSVTGDIALDVAYSLTMVAAGATATPDTVAAAVLRSAAMASTAMSATPDTVTLNTSAVWTMFVAASTATSDAGLAVSRPLALAAAAATLAAAGDLVVARQMALAAAAATATPDTLALDAENALPLSFSAAAQTATGEVAMPLARALGFAAIAVMETGAAALVVERMMAVSMAATTSAGAISLMATMVVGIVTLSASGRRPGATAAGRQPVILGEG